MGQEGELAGAFFTAVCLLAFFACRVWSQGVLLVWQNRLEKLMWAISAVAFGMTTEVILVKYLSVSPPLPYVAWVAIISACAMGVSYLFAPYAIEWYCWFRDSLFEPPDKPPEPPRRGYL